MPKEKLEKKTEEASTSEQDEVISEAEQKQIKEVHDVNREMVLMELKSLGMSEEQVAFNRKSANDSALLFLRDEYRRREQKDVKNQNKRESIYQLFASSCSSFVVYHRTFQSTLLLSCFVLPWLNLP
jgi:protease II